MNETNTWEYLRDVVLPHGHYSRIESPDTAPGFPDVHYSTEYSTGTLELKYAKNVDPPFPEDVDKGGLRRSQIIWINEEIRWGGIVWIVAELPPRVTRDIGVILCIPGRYADQFNGATFEDLSEWAVEDGAVIYRDRPDHAATELERILNDG